MRIITTITYKNIPVDILRLDLEQPTLQGNKYFKLQYNIEQALAEKRDGLLTFGGAFSNHIYAVAIAGKLNGLKTAALIRGEDDPLNPTLIACKELGMEIHPISRLAYQNKSGKDMMAAMRGESDNWYVIPEGGSNTLAVKGCTEILAGLETAYDTIFCATGTGGTLAGIIATPGRTGKVCGIAVLKGEDTLTATVAVVITKAGYQNNGDWDINFNYHLGGYARYDHQLMQSIDNFYKTYNILPDPIYSGRTFYAVLDMIDKGIITNGTRVLAIHTGGLQGWKGWNYRFINKMKESGFGPLEA